MKKFLIGLFVSILGVVGALTLPAMLTNAIDDDPDCDTVAIIRCGVMTAPEVLQEYDEDDYGDVSTVYNNFGISRADIAAGGFVTGVLWRDGTIKLGQTGTGATVATNAVTAGRWYNPTEDMTYIPGTVRAYRMNPSHMLDAQTAWVKLTPEGRFDFAVIKSCGNPVSATPVPPPTYSCDALIVTRVDRDTYRFTIQGRASGGAVIIGYHFWFGDGTNYDQTGATAEHTYERARTYNTQGDVIVRVGSVTKRVTSEACKKQITVEQEPVYSCDALNKEIIDRDTRRFTAKATAKHGAVIVSYKFDFGDGRTEMTTDKVVEHTYAQPGTYTAKLSVQIRVDGQTKVVTGPNCIQRITVDQEPVYSCDALEVKKISQDTYRFTAKATAKHGAEIKSYKFYFGDGKDKFTAEKSVEHTYDRPGEYNAWLNVNIKVDGEVKDVTGPNCKAKITIKQEPVYSCDSLEATKIDRDSYTFVGAATAKHGATIKDFTYEFGDGEKVTTTEQRVVHTYDRPGTYTARLTVTFRVDGELKKDTGPECVQRITVKQAPSYSCDALKVEKIDRDTFNFQARASADGGAEIVGYRFEFGDGEKTDTTRSTTQHDYARPGNYTARVTVKVRVDGEVKEVTGPNCKAPVKVEQPPAEPVYTCDSLKANKINRTTYQFDANATAKDGAEIVSYNFNFGDGESKTSESDKITHSYDRPGDYKARVTVKFRVDGVIKEVTGPQCTVNVTVQPPAEEPIYRCDALSFVQIDRDSFRFKGQATAEQGAEIVSYNFNFGDGTKTSGAESVVRHDYTAPGEYTIRLSVTFLVKGETKTVTSPACVKNVTVAPEEVPNPDYGCTSLTAEIISNDSLSYKYLLDYYAENGAILRDVDFNFGDGSTKTVERDQLGNVTHAYAKGGDYTTTATLHFLVGNNGSSEVKDKKCQVQISIPVPVCPYNPELPPNHPGCYEPCPTNPDFPIGSPECEETPMCPYNPELPIGSPECELPSTGPAALIGSIMGIGSTTAAAYYWVQSRRDWLKALK